MLNGVKIACIEAFLVINSVCFSKQRIRCCLFYTRYLDSGQIPLVSKSHKVYKDVNPLLPQKQIWQDRIETHW